MSDDEITKLIGTEDARCVRAIKLCVELQRVISAKEAEIIRLEAEVKSLIEIIEPDGWK